MAATQRIVIYTCITGGYDDLLEPLAVDPEVDYICVSDRAIPADSVWKHMPLPFETGDDSAKNRYVKMHPHLLFPGYDISVYVDGNIQVVSTVAALAREAMGFASIALYQHSFRNCVYAEAVECAALGHDWRWRISAQMQRYRREGFPSGRGLFEGNVIIRNNRSPEIAHLMDLWWDEYRRYARRDQLSLTYLSWKTAVSIYNLGSSDPRGARTTFSLQKIHVNNSPLVRLRRATNRRLLALGLFKVPTVGEPWPCAHSDE